MGIVRFSDDSDESFFTYATVAECGLALDWRSGDARSNRVGGTKINKGIKMLVLKSKQLKQKQTRFVL